MKRDIKYTYMFGGGAIRGLAYVGAIKALDELGVKPNMIAGSSVGAIVAGLLALGYTSEEIKESFINISFDLFRDIKLGFGPLIALSKGELFLEWLRDLIGTKFYGTAYRKGESEPVKFKDIDADLVIITTDLKNFECQEFSKFTTPDYEIASAIRISSCMPGLMVPVEYNGRILVDGDLQKSFPMWKLSENLFKSNSRLLEFRLEGEYDDNSKNGVSYANAVYSCMTAMSTAFITETFSQNDRFDYIVLNTGEVVVVDFNLSKEKRQELIDSGYKQTMAYFKEKLPQKKKGLLDAYSIIQGHILRMNGFLKFKKYKKVKSELGDLFINLSELSNIIDERDYIALKHLKDVLIENMLFGLLGHVKLKNEEYVKAELTKISAEIDKKVDDLAIFMKNFTK